MVNSRDAWNKICEEEPPRDECQGGCKDCDYYNTGYCTYPLKTGGIA